MTKHYQVELTEEEIALLVKRLDIDVSPLCIRVRDKLLEAAEGLSVEEKKLNDLLESIDKRLSRLEASRIPEPPPAPRGPPPDPPEGY